MLDVWSHLTLRRRIQLAMLLLVMLASGLAELLSLGAVLPFLSVLSDPQQFWQQPKVLAIAGFLGLSEANELLLPAIFFFALSVMLAALIRLTNLWLNVRLASAVGTDLSCEAYRRTLYQSYQVHIQRNSAEVITRTITQIDQTVASLGQLLNVITSTIVALAVLVGLLVIDASMAVAAAALFGIVYFMIAITARQELQTNSNKISNLAVQQLKSLQEGLGAIRDVLLDGTQETYLQIYQKADRPLRLLQARNSFLSSFPRYTLEALGISLIAALGGLLVLQRPNSASVIPVLGALALGSQRVLPSLQQIYGGWAVLKSHNAAIQAVLEMLNQSMPPQTSWAEPLPLREHILMDEVHFRYRLDQPDVLCGLNLEIRPGDRVGVIGTTGSGKSTMVDLLMGLLVPVSGSILIDGNDLHDPAHPDRLKAWRASIAHVPQIIYLADGSIAENIAFGLPLDQIDMDRVKQVAAQAQISSLVETMPYGYYSCVGERGISLSGGQRQRIGIARALYKRASILVLDEATSALDTCTEKSVMSTFQGLSEKLTIITIAHRLSTIEFCNRVIRIQNGTLIDKAIPVKR